MHSCTLFLDSKNIKASQFGQLSCRLAHDPHEISNFRLCCAPFDGSFLLSQSVSVASFPRFPFSIHGWKFLRKVFHETPSFVCILEALLYITSELHIVPLGLMMPRVPRVVKVCHCVRECGVGEGRKVAVHLASDDQHFIVDCHDNFQKGPGYKHRAHTQLLFVNSRNYFYFLEVSESVLHSFSCLPAFEKCERRVLFLSCQ